MERGSTKHGPLLDDELKHEVEGMDRSGHSTRAEQWREVEPVDDADAPSPQLPDEDRPETD